MSNEIEKVVAEMCEHNPWIGRGARQLVDGWADRIKAELRSAQPVTSEPPGCPTPGACSCTRAAGWQPIGTAPKDGVVFCFWEPSAPMGELDRHRLFGMARCTGGTWWHHPDDDDDGYCTPTYWMPVDALEPPK